MAAHIFIDLDGVLADFDRHAREQGKTTPEGKVKYGALDYAWWSTMPACGGAKEFYDAAQALGTVKFLTGPILSEECFSGKAHWVMGFVPERGRQILNDLIICPSKDKPYLAGPGRILIDDRAENIAAWEAAGGIGIHHTGDFAVTMAKLQKAVAPSPRPPLRRPSAPTP